MTTDYSYKNIPFKTTGVRNKVGHLRNFNSVILIEGTSVGI